MCLSLTGMPHGLGQLSSLLTLTEFVVDSNGIGLSELQSLNSLRGQLSIRILGGHDSGRRRGSRNSTAEEIKGTNYLESKQFLKTLKLYFYDEEEEDELLLESLRPHPNLKELEIYDYGGVSFPCWMMVDKIGLLSSSLPNLVRIEMKWCHTCNHLPPFGQLPCLQFLTLWNMYSLEYIEDNSSRGSGSGGGGEATDAAAAAAIARRSPTFFPSLKQLTLGFMPSLKGCWRREAEAEAEEASFPSLSILHIEMCPNLASMPILPPCLKQIRLRWVSKMLVEQVSPTDRDTNRDTVASTSSSSSLLPLSNLKSLELSLIEDLDTLPEWIVNLTSLERLQIRFCRKLKSLPDGMRQLTALQQLTIRCCTTMLYDRCQKETGKDWPNIAHIPILNISRW